MEPLSPELTRLDVCLTALPTDCDAMLLSEVDGFLAGVVVSPEPILPSEWLAAIWRQDAGRAFGSESGFDELVGLIFKHYNSIAYDLAKDDDRYQPIYDIDGEEILWETWISGFEAAMALRPDSWKAILESDDQEAASAFSIMAALAMIADGATSEDLDGVEVDELAEAAPLIIPACVQSLSDWRPRPPRAGRPENTHQGCVQRALRPRIRQDVEEAQRSGLADRVASPVGQPISRTDTRSRGRSDRGP